MRFYDLGVTNKLKTEEAQIVRLTNISAAIPAIGYFFYIWYGFYFDQIFASIQSASMLLLTGTIFYCNKQENYGLAKFILFSLNSFGIWMAYHVFSDNYFVLTSFFPIIFGFPLLFNIKRERAYFISSVLFTSVCVISSFVIPRQIIYASYLAPEIIELSNFFHFAISTIVTILIAYTIFKNRDTTYQKLISEKERVEATLNSLKQTQTRLVQAEKMASLGILLAGVNQEVSNPLKVIDSGVTSLETLIEKDSKIDLKIYEKNFCLLKGGIKELDEVITNLNHFNYQTSGIESKCDINLLINNCLTILKSDIGDSIFIEKNLTDSNQFVKGNLGQLHQVFFNILTNAIHAVQKGGTIFITTQKEGKTVSTSISDTGIGIPEEIIGNIFDPFFSTKSSNKGTGLGLSIAYQIITDHFGTIDINSETDQGSEVTILLPEYK